MLTRRKRKPGQSEETQPSDGVTVTKRHRNSERKPNMDLDELHPVTVETRSVSDGRGTILKRLSQINLLSFCVFCLRKTSTVNQSNVPPPSLLLNREDVSSEELLEDVPRACFLGSSSQLLATFNRIWAYLGKGKQGVELNEDPLLHLFKESQANGNSRMTAFVDLPRMCVPCAANLQTVHRLFTELRAQLDGIERIIKESKYSGKYSWRAEHFEKVLTTSNLEQQVIAATLDILDKLGGNEGNEMNVNLYSDETVGHFVPEPAVPASAYLPTSFQESQSASALYGGANRLPEIPPVTQILPNCLTDSIESGTQLGPKITGSSYVEVTSVEDSLGANFVDEDDDWVEDKPDHVKSEPEHDFREEDDSSADDKDDDFADEWTPPRTRGKFKTPTPLNSAKKEGVNRVCASRTKSKKGNYRKRAEESGQVLVRKNPETGKEMFSCGIDGCGRTYSRWIAFRAHQLEKHSRGLEKKHQCDLCDKSFLLPNSLTNHKQTHSVKMTKAGKLVKDKSTLDTLMDKAGGTAGKTGSGEKDNLGGISAPVIKIVQTVAESTILRHLLRQTSIQDNQAEDAKFLPGPPSISHAEASRADGSFSGNFVDEDDDWNGNESDPDYIKSEPEDDLSEEQESSEEDDNLEEWTPPRKRRNVMSLKEISVQSDSAVEKKGGQRHDCDQCEKSFLLPHHLRNHKRLAHAAGKLTKDKNDKIQMCDLCKETVPLNDIRAHVREHVGNEFLIPCPNPICQFTFSKPSALSKHLATKINKRCRESASVEFLEMAKYTKCQECGRRLSDRRQTNVHLLFRHENSTKNFSCPINGCYQQFTVRQSVQFHIESHQLTSVQAGDPLSTQTCTLCNSTVELEEMANHLKVTHGFGAEDLFKCSQCPFVFPKREHLVDHLFEHRNSVLYCDICGDQVNFSLYLELREHYGNVHNVGKRFPCEHCEYVGWTQNALEQHTGMEHERHRCDLCGKSFSNQNGLHKHKEQVHVQELVKGYPQMCDLCRMSIPVEQMRAHVREHVGDEYLIPCPNLVCPYAYSKPYSLYKHLVLHSKRCSKSVSNLEKILEMAKGNKCQECEYQAKKSIGLRYHLLREHETSTKNFSCPIDGCHEKFTVKQSVQFHIATHKTRRMPKPLTTQKCCQCDGTFDLEEMETHLKGTHGAVEVVKCSHCSFVYPTREQLVDHLYEHRSSVMSCDICGDQVKFSKHARLREHYFNEHNIGKRFPCEYCSSVCWTQRNWMDHMARTHKKETGQNGDLIIKVPGKQSINKKPYKCHVSDCDAAYTSLSLLQDHKIKEHGAEAYNCKICTATFLVRKRLLKHEKEHGAIKFACEVEGCGKSFDKNCSLKSHMSTAHRGERPHVCELCGKSYAQRQGLKSHKDVVHLGLRSHVCDTCGESFTNGSSLKRHKLVHTGERPFGCDICGQRFRHKEVLKTHVEGHRKKGADFKPNGPMKQVRKRIEKKDLTSI